MTTENSHSVAALSRRAFLAGLPLAALAACTTAPRMDLGPVAPVPTTPAIDPAYVAMYGPLPDERFPIPALDLSVIDPQFLRHDVVYVGAEQPGTIVVQTARRFVYLVRENGRAMRYGVGVGREGMELQGNAVISHKAEWPRWTPTAAMIAREPDRYARWAGGMDPGLGNPLGARALYLYRNGRDTAFRLHGTNEPRSIGHSVSSGCIRLFNHDIIDLYGRVPLGTRVLVLPVEDARPRDQSAA